MGVAQQNHVRKTSGKSQSDHDLHLQEISKSMSKLNYQGVSMRVTFNFAVGSSVGFGLPKGDAPPKGRIALQNHDDDQGIPSAKGM
jgi:hypothetical protein